MFREKVSSSHIAAIGYDARDQVLEIEFRDASVYQYICVPEDVYAEMMRTESHGEFLNQQIKDAGYLCKQV